MMTVMTMINDDNDLRWTKFSGVGWYFNKFYPHTGLVEAAQFTVKEDM